MEGAVDGHGAAQRLAEEHDPFGRLAQARGQVVVGGAHVAEQALLARPAGAAAVAAIIEGEDVERQAEQLAEEVDAVTEAARVAVAEEQRALGLRLRHPPAVELDAVAGREPLVLGGEA